MILKNKCRKYFKFLTIFLFLIVFSSISCDLEIGSGSGYLKYCSDFDNTKQEDRFYVKSKSSRSVSLHWPIVCHEETASIKERSENWYLKLFRSQEKEDFERFTKKDLHELDVSIVNILLEPATTYYYKLELWHYEKGKLMQVGNTLEVTTDSEDKTPVLSQEDIDNAIEIKTKSAGGETCSGDASACYDGILNTTDKSLTFLGLIEPQEYSIQFSFSYGENDEKINSYFKTDFYYDIFELDGVFLGRIDNIELPYDYGEDSEFLPRIHGNNYIRVGYWGELEQSFTYRAEISQWDTSWDEYP